MTPNRAARMKMFATFKALKTIPYGRTITWSGFERKPTNWNNNFPVLTISPTKGIDSLPLYFYPSPPARIDCWLTREMLNAWQHI